MLPIKENPDRHFGKHQDPEVGSEQVCLIGQCCLVGTSFSTSHSVYDTLQERYYVHTHAYTEHSVHNTLQ